MKKNVLSLVFFINIVLSIFGQTGSGFVSVENSGRITITGYNGTERNVIIPDEVNGMPIIAIGENAFISKDLTSVIIGNNIMGISKNYNIKAENMIK